jgi:hypothetical protein
MVLSGEVQGLINLKVAWTTIIITVCVLVFGAWLHLRFTQIDWSPHTTDAIDEIWVFNETYERYITPGDERRLDGYPPFILWVQAVAWRIVNFNWEGGSAAIPSLTLTRQLTVIPAVITLLLLFLIGKTLHSDLVGWVIALGWAVQPSMLEATTYALTEAWQILFIALALWLAMLGLRRSLAQHLRGFSR